MSKALTTRPSPQLPGLLTAADAARVVDSFVVSIEGRNVLLDRMPSVDERKVMQARNLELASLLRPAHMSIAETKRGVGELAAMFGGYPSLRSANVQDMLDAYWGRLRDYPIGAIAAACNAVANNEIPDLDPDWPPASPRLLKIAKEFVSKLALERAKIEQILTARLTMRPDVTPEQAGRIQQGLNDFAAHMKAVTESRSMLTKEEREDVAQRTIKKNDQDILAEYRKLNIDPVYSGGRPMSVSLARRMGKINGRTPPARSEVPVEAYGDNLVDGER